MGSAKSKTQSSTESDADQIVNNKAPLYFPKKQFKNGTRCDTLHKTMTATIRATLNGHGNMRDTVSLPEGEDLCEQLAVNTIYFFNAASMVYGTCAEFCSVESCPKMSAGAKYEYLQADGCKFKKPIRLPAPIYMENLFTQIDDQISDVNLFPVEEGAKFPKTFIDYVKNIFKRLFRLYAHIYYSHFEQICKKEVEAHLNTCFKHIIFFILEFDLVDPKELQPLQKLIDRLTNASIHNPLISASQMVIGGGSSSNKNLNHQNQNSR